MKIYLIQTQNENNLILSQKKYLGFTSQLITAH